MRFSYLLCVLWTGASIAYRDDIDTCFFLGAIAAAHWVLVLVAISATFMAKDPTTPQITGPTPTDNT